MTKEALRLALEALSEAHYVVEHRQDVKKREQAITAIKEALAQPEHGWTPERIAGMARLKEAQDKKLAQVEQPKVRTGNCLRVGVCASEGHKIQPQRTWVGLTELEKAEITSLKWWDWEDTFDIDGFIKAIEAKLKEKNA